MKDGTIMSESKLNSFLYRYRVRIGFFSIIASILLSRSSPLSLLVGLGVIGCGLLLRTWACGHLRKEKVLAVSGPYRYTRNPLYLGNLIIGLGVVVSSRSIWVAVLLAVNFIIIYPFVINREKRRMKDFFPHEYEEFKRKVPLFFPRIPSSLPKSEVRFSGELYHKNSEIRALYGALAFWVFMTLKMLLF